jgi:hypothetical protein
MPKADATGLAPEKSADHNPSRTPFVCAGGLPSAVAPRCFYFQPLHGPSTTVPSQNSKPISLVKSLSGGLGLKTRRPPGCLCRALRIPIFFALLLLGYRSRLHRRVSYPTRALSRLRRLVRPKRNPRNWPENSQTPSGENSVTRYNSSSFLPSGDGRSCENSTPRVYSVDSVESFAVERASGSSLSSSRRFAPLTKPTFRVGFPVVLLKCQAISSMSSLLAKRLSS